MSQMTSRRTGSVTGARVCTIIAFVLAALAVLFLPPVLGLAAVVLGLVGGYLGDRPLGWYAAAAGVAGAVLGMVLGAIILNAS
ncbi:hypothetical protein Aab01nite_48880 [Paractinoplanes abujensis]|uniref:Putative membrane protein n=1 Tax=Paractinoplanes abujensis TaxID=882441 RepID=A0A7W7G2V0_9ACTN|nr:hypothetical protein [Actinoplanes abujensis]MBB4694044.1 putative membrane protein [Actinoplanes abujensis]GID21298.1 hypothetical protein Aab01nite_48880 [Actinoplanes abujensis]